jgi:cobalt/nickel transport system permease protein
MLLASSVLSPEPLHIPDGFLSTPVALIGWILVILLVGYALRMTREQLGERQVPLMGILAAFIFAAQMLNFPVAGGTSGHLLGGALAAIVLGPWAASLVMTSVVTIQALLFQDGGLLVLGWNIINMGILAAFTGYLVYRAVQGLLGSGRRSALLAGFAGSWLSVMVGASATAIELAVSGTSPLSVGLPAMAGVHALIGIGEALITVAALAFVSQTRPDLLDFGRSTVGSRSASWIWVGLVLALGLAALSPLASGSPDGLEWVAGEQGFLARGLDPVFEILPDYTVPVIENEAVTTIVAGAIGTLIVFGVTYAVARLRRGRQETKV